jgi:hypothetical protein
VNELGITIPAFYAVMDAKTDKIIDRAESHSAALRRVGYLASHEGRVTYVKPVVVR